MGSIFRLCGLLLAFFVTVVVPPAQAAETAPYTEADTAAVAVLMNKGVKVIDIRRPEEWRETGVIPGSKLLTAFDAGGRFNSGFPSEFESFVDKDEEIIIICRSGNRSSALSRVLAERAGYSRIYNASGGILSWIDQGKPTAPCPAC